MQWHHREPHIQNSGSENPLSESQKKGFFHHEMDITPYKHSQQGAMEHEKKLLLLNQSFLVKVLDFFSNRHPFSTTPFIHKTTITKSKNKEQKKFFFLVQISYSISGKVMLF